MQDCVKGNDQEPPFLRFSSVPKGNAIKNVKRIV